jgi:SAM-dependent methyltransferase
MSEWFETLEDRFWLGPDDRSELEARFIKRVLHLRKGQWVLDAPCGDGRIALCLAEAGCRVTGIDLRRRFIQRARRRFWNAGLRGTVEVMDIRNLDYKNEFQGILNWFGSFGYFSDTDNLDVIRRYASALKPGGRLLIDQANRERILRNFIHERTSGAVIFRNRWDKSTQRVIARRVVNGRDDAANMSSIRLYTFNQMCGLYERAGLRVEAVYGSASGEAYSRLSRRMILVGRK